MQQCSRLLPLPTDHRRRGWLVVVAAVDFDEDPNAEPSLTQAERPASSRTPQQQAGNGPDGNQRKRQAAGGRGGGRQGGQQRRSGPPRAAAPKPSAEELRAMGYDDVDDFDDADSVQFERLELREDDPL
jgi:hypothetical protein